jgi:ribosome-associated translation inhibitor RaiA
MKRFIELKHIGPRTQVRQLIDELLDRLEHKVRHFSPDAVSAHVLFEENGTRTLFRASVTCHVPRRMVAAHEEQRDPGAAIRRAFKEVERQLEKQDTMQRQRHLRKRAVRTQRELLGMALVMAIGVGLGFGEGWAQEEPVALSAEAQELIKGLGSEDSYLRQKAFIRLEALREPATAAVVRRYLASRDVNTRAFSVRALAAIEGVAAIPTLMERATRDKPRVRVTALLALEPLADQEPALVPFFIGKLRDRNAEVRMAAVDIVSRLDDPRAREALNVRWRRERHRDVRRILERLFKPKPPSEDQS